MHQLIPIDMHSNLIIFRIPNIIILIEIIQNSVVDNELDIDAFVKSKTKRFKLYLQNIKLNFKSAMTIIFYILNRFTAIYF